VENEIKVCKRCICDETIPKISFDSEGVCNYCRLHDEMERKYPISDEIVDNILREIKGNSSKKYDCVIGISGGCDSSYLLWKLCEFGIRPLAVHWDNHWNSDIAERNMHRMVTELEVDFIRVEANKKEYDDICRAFLFASTPDADIANDIALTTVLYDVADSFGIKYIINGHSFRTEGTSPLGWTYMDGKYIESVHEKFGTVPLKTFPNLTMERWLKWLEAGIKRVRLLYHMNYIKSEAKKELHKNFGWEWYGSHHAENRYTKFVGKYLWVKKFGIDYRKIEYSALVRSGQMDRDDALEKIKNPIEIESDIIDEVKRRLHLTDEQFNEILKMPIKTYSDYETYHDYFRRNKDMFKKLLDDGMIPETFYKKYVEGV